MATTTLRLDDDPTARIAAAARAGTTDHAFMVDAIARMVEAAEADIAFVRLAAERWAQVAATGETVPWEPTKAWIEARLRGEAVEKPTGRVRDE